MSNYDKENIQAIIDGEGDWFTAKLIRLIIHADLPNRRRMFAAYPEEVHAVNVFNFGKECAKELESDWR